MPNRRTAEHNGLDYEPLDEDFSIVLSLPDHSSLLLEFIDLTGDVVRRRSLRYLGAIGLLRHKRDKGIYFGVYRNLRKNTFHKFGNYREERRRWEWRRSQIRSAASEKIVASDFCPIVRQQSVTTNEIFTSRRILVRLCVKMINNWPHHKSLN